MKSKSKLLILFSLVLQHTIAIAQNNYNSGTIKDIDGNSYSLISYRGYDYMSENLKVKRFLNGDTILESKNAQDWIKNCSDSIPTYMINNLYPELGYMYNGFAVYDPRGLFPSGFNIPGDSIYYEEFWENKYLGNENNRKEFELNLLGKIYTTSNAYNSDCRKSKSFYIEPDGIIYESPCIGGRWWMEEGIDKIDNSFSTACCTGHDGAHHGDYFKSNWQSWGFYARGIKKQ